MTSNTATRGVRFIVKFEDGGTDSIWVDRWTLNRGDHIASTIAGEWQLEGRIKKGDIIGVTRASAV